jgi:hypothetical protein
LNNYGVKFDLPDHLGDKAHQFGESSYGAVRLTLVLKDGSTIKHVHTAGGRSVIKASDPQSEERLNNLSHSDIVDVLPED